MNTIIFTHKIKFLNYTLESLRPGLKSATYLYNYWSKLIGKQNFHFFFVFYTKN